MFALAYLLGSFTQGNAEVILNWIFQDVSLVWRLNLSSPVVFTDTINF